MSPSAPNLTERRRRQTRLEVSDVALTLFAAQGCAKTSVEEIATAAGISMRTFHRYFANKEAVVAPVLDAGWREYVQLVAARPADEPVIDSLLAAFAAGLDSETKDRHWQLLRSLEESPTLEPIWLSVQQRCAEALRPVLAHRLGLAPDSTRARYVSVCCSSANQLAIETWSRDPNTDLLQTVRECLTAIEGDLLTPADETIRS